MLRVAFQGELGAYGEAAVRSYFGESADPIPSVDFPSVTSSVEFGAVDYGVLPVENSIVGRVEAAILALGRGRVRIVGGVEVAIEHCLLAMPGTDLEGIRRAESHPIALAQCSAFFSDHAQITAVSSYDTAGAAAEVARAGDPARAAIAGAAAAGRYGLQILATGIADRSDNRTRFLIIAPRSIAAKGGRTSAAPSAAMPVSTPLPKCSEEWLTAVLRVVRKPARRIIALLPEISV
ncbi:MAG: prephenate dehydratase [Gemmatimonadetes bacterium]|nr:prephenate dehydratase [Gemmatimonadota bacterium]